MEEKLKHTILKLLFSREAILLVIVIFFYIIWSESINKYIYVAFFISFPLFVVAGLLIPIILLVAALKYNSSIAFYITFAVFASTMIIELLSMPYYFRQYNLEQLNGQPECYCNPILEIRMSLKSILISVTAIILMHTKKVFKPFNLKKANSYRLFGVLVLLYFFFGILNKIFYFGL